MTEKASPGLIAYVEQLAAYHKDPGQAPHKNPPRPPTPEIGIEAAVVIAKMMAMVVDYQQTGELHEEPSVVARLAVAEIIQKQMNW